MELSCFNSLCTLTFSLLKHYLDLCITDTALIVFPSLYCFTTSVSHGVENYFPRLWVSFQITAMWRVSCQVSVPECLIVNYSVFICKLIISIDDLHWLFITITWPVCSFKP